MNNEVRNLTIMVRGAYDLQKLRMQMGLRLVGNFRAKLKVAPEAESTPQAESAPKKTKKPKKSSEPESDSNPTVQSGEPEITEEGEKILDVLRN